MTTLVLEADPAAASVAVTETELVVQLTDGRSLAVRPWSTTNVRLLADLRTFVSLLHYRRNPALLGYTRPTA